MYITFFTYYSKFMKFMIVVEQYILFIPLRISQNFYKIRKPFSDPFRENPGKVNLISLYVEMSCKWKCLLFRLAVTSSCSDKSRAEVRAGFLWQYRLWRRNRRVEVGGGTGNGWTQIAVLYRSWSAHPESVQSKECKARPRFLLFSLSSLMQY